MDYFSLAVGFLVGTATGAAGTYFGNKYTDQRKAKEQKKEIKSFYKSLWAKHEPLLKEMRQDLKNPDFKFHREFFLLSRSWSFVHAGKFLAYYLEEHENLEQQIKILESHGLIIEVTEFGKNVKKYQFSEHLVEHLLAE
ncbi:hypothetical protein QX220_21820 [Vibrio vulnificus]|uniref:hypothetical protein n=1 Tax=Vibrio vulnificus TaxID=672 RepID=UPI001A248AD0|nr:hypothetical protein [Vibrio vulnificus]MDS1864264.1 hypothetical protein [Vibrio vulnificus]HAS6168105.1 hypothetical protein [Vibrio vulnificus]HAU8262095.1 hypothetical protein [Vibrio vulnificus]HDM8245731.1 hypothetical protein [Vibrio campbellii]